MSWAEYCLTWARLNGVHIEVEPEESHLERRQLELESESEDSSSNWKITIKLHNLHI